MISATELGEDLSLVLEYAQPWKKAAGIRWVLEADVYFDVRNREVIKGVFVQVAYRYGLGQIIHLQVDGWQKSSWCSRVLEEERHKTITTFEAGNGKVRSAITVQVTDCQIRR